ncbi:MAG: transcription elongation factor GreA [Actinomycetota bacterium]
MALPDKAQQDEHHLSPAAYERLKAELEELTTVGRIEIARKIEEARALGDLSENGDYHAAKETQGHMEGRIRQIQALLENAVIVESSSAGDVVAPGSTVAIRYEGDDDVERFLVGSIEERHHSDVDVISPGSPLGQALIGKKVGEPVGYEAPSGELTVEIVGVES